MLRCRRTDARNATAGSDKATSSTAAEVARLLKAVRDAPIAEVTGGVANIREKRAVAPASGSGDSRRILAAG